MCARCFVLFLIFVSTCVCVCLRVQGPLRVPSGRALPCFPIITHHFDKDTPGPSRFPNIGLIKQSNTRTVPALLGRLAVWRHNIKNKKNGIARRDGNARTTCRMKIAIWETIPVKHPNFWPPRGPGNPQGPGSQTTKSCIAGPCALKLESRTGSSREVETGK